MTSAIATAPVMIWSWRRPAVSTTIGGREGRASSWGFIWVFIGDSFSKRPPSNRRRARRVSATTVAAAGSADRVHRRVRGHAPPPGRTQVRGAGPEPRMRVPGEVYGPERPPVRRDAEAEHPGRHDASPPKSRIVGIFVGQRGSIVDLLVALFIRQVEPTVLLGVDPLSARRLRQWALAGLSRCLQ